VKSNRAITSTILEERLLAWIAKCEELQLPVITGATTCEIAARLRDELLLSASPSIATKLREQSFSNGWLYKFQLRHGLLW